MDLLPQLTQYAFSGLSTGAIYALIGLGFAIIYNATGIINFAQGEFVMLGGVLTHFFLVLLKFPVGVAMVAAVAVGVAEEAGMEADGTVTAGFGLVPQLLRLL